MYKGFNKGAGLGLRGRRSGLLLADAIPIDLAGEVHDDGQDDEEPDATEEQCIVLQLYEGEDVGVQATDGKHKACRHFGLLEDAIYIKPYERYGGYGSYKVGDVEACVFGYRQQQRVENAEGNAYQHILQRVHLALLEYLYKEEDSKGEGDDEDGVFDRAVGFGVAVGGLHQPYPKGRLADAVGNICSQRLRVVARYL